MIKQYAIIVAGGKGNRMKNNTPKQFLLLNGKPMLMYSIAAFYKYSPEIEIIVVLPDGQEKYWKMVCEKFNFHIKHKIVMGGKTRAESVSNGLRALEENGYVAIHDGARPVVTSGLIKACFNTAKEKGNALPVVEVTDSIRMVDKENNKPIKRTSIRICQTPQVFLCSEIKNAYKQRHKEDFTDDASVLESVGYKIFLTPGQIQNIKVTTMTDMVLAETFLSQRQII